MTSGQPPADARWVRLSTPTDGAAGTRGAHDHDDGRMSRRRVYRGVTVAAVAVVLAVALASVLAARSLAEVEAVGDAADTADILADSLVEPALSDGLLTGDPAALAAIDRVVRDHVLGGSIVRVKLWDASGRIVYSDEPRLIGQSFDLEEEELEVLTTPRTDAEVSDVSAPENRYESGAGELLEVYRPVTTPGGEALLFETYFRYDQVVESGARLWQGFAAVTVGSILLMVIALLPVLRRLLAQLARSQAQREALLQRALDASADERRRIAGTLHDGVVQDLVAASFSLAGAERQAAARGDDASAGELNGAAAAVRGSIGGLRSLLVDIYPASLATSGLAAALDDLVAATRSRGIRVDMDVAGALGLDDAGERLVFRTAQEVLGNTAKHAAATEVTVRLAREGGAVVLEIRDDGVGFDVAATLARPEEGHFGLRVLGDVAAAARAGLSVASAPGEGTRWRLEVPVS
jgi:signal transduction histidine kinase